MRIPSLPTIDVVFVHGLLGGVFITWRQRPRRPGVLGILERFLGCEIYPDRSFDTQVNVRPYKEVNVFHEAPPSDENITDDGKSEEVSEENNIEEGGHQEEKCVVSARDNCESGDDYTDCWPMDWLPKDCTNLRILGVNYDTGLSHWTGMQCSCSGPSGPSLGDRARDMLDRLMQAGVGQGGRSVVWVAHSMGGLLVKDMLVQAYSSDTKIVRDMCANTRGVVFLATPHHGSSLANLAPSTAALLWPTLEVQEMREDSPSLMVLHQRFLEVLKAHPFEIVSMCEDRPILLTALKVPVMLVTPSSANPGVGEFYKTPYDHLSICKPNSRNSFFYRRLLKVLRNTMEFRRKMAEQHGSHS